MVRVRDSRLQKEHECGRSKLGAAGRRNVGVSSQEPPSDEWAKNPALRFLIVGLGNTAAGLTLILAFKHGLGFNDIHSNLLGYAVMLPIAFLLNRRWTFQHEGDGCTAFVRYLLTLGAAYAMNLGVVVMLTKLSTPGDWAQVFGVLVYAAVGFFGSRYFAFRTQTR